MEKSRILRNAGLLIEVELKFDIDISPDIKEIYNAFIKAGKKLYLVGGAVRDAVLGMKPKDFDLATDAKPEEVQKILSNSGIKCFPKGESFGVVSAIINNEEYEIATFREESYEGGDGRRPTSVGYSDIFGDVKRRDLTINALYYDIAEGKIIDLVGGLDDIKNKRVRPVGNSYDRFNEDRLRVLRAVRFAHRFGTKLDKETINAIISFKTLPGVSNERIRDEFLKGLKSAITPEDFLQDYKNFDFFNRMFEGVNFDFNFVKGLKDPTLVLALLLCPNKIDKVLKSLTKFTASNTEKENIKFLLSLDLFFEDFDKLSFIPESDGKVLLNLVKLREVQNNNLSDEQILQWAKIRSLDQTLIHKFLAFKLKFSASDFPELPPSAELGKAITKSNAEEFLKSL